MSSTLAASVVVVLYNIKLLRIFESDVNGNIACEWINLIQSPLNRCKVGERY